jgi:signal transduction histidine kinase
VVKGYTSLLEEGSFGAVNEKQKETLGKVFKTNEDMINMVNDLLNVTRAEEGRLQYSFEKTDLRELIKIAAKALELAAKQKGLTLEYRLGAEPVYVNADKDKMTQVFSNLIDNAIKYTEKGGVKIDFSIDGQSNAVRVWVADTGPGIGEEEMRHLFESFSRGKAGIKSWTKGTGMGLYIAKQFVEAHKGKIWATSEGEGKGSTFFVELPIQ